jgi:hypothetical protein
MASTIKVDQIQSDSGNVALGGSINITGTGRRITGDFSNATVANRTMFQTSTENGNTSVGSLTNGTAQQSAFSAFNANDPSNASSMQIVCNAGESRLAAERVGTGTFLPMTFYTGGTERVRIGTDGQQSSAIVGASGLYPEYKCRAWVNFNGTANSNLIGTYTRTSPSTTVTITATAHGLIVGNQVQLDFTTGTGVDGTYTVVTVDDENTFTVTTVATTTTSGNVTILRNTIRGSGNVTSITDGGVGIYTINFATAMPDENFAAVVSSGTTSTQNNSGQTNFFFPILVKNASNAFVDDSRIQVAVFR